MARKKMRKRNFVKGTNAYSGWIVPVVFAGIFIVLMYRAAQENVLGDYGSKPWLQIIGILIICGILYACTATVWVSSGSTVYHRRKGCAGANKKANRMIAKMKGLQPCSKCHKVAGMNRN